MKNFFSGKAGKISFYAIVCVLIISVFISLWLNLSGVLEFLKGCLSVLAPLIYAVVVVLIVNPTVHLFREKVFGFLEKEKPGQSEKSKKRRAVLAKALAIFCAYLIFLVLVAAVIVIVFVPLFQSASDFQTIIPSYLNSAIEWIDKTIAGSKLFAAQHDEIMAYVNDSLQVSFDRVQAAIPVLLASLRNVVSEATTIAVGLIISVYIIASLDYLRRARDKIMAAFFTPETTERILRRTRVVHTIFSGYLTGRLLCSVALELVFFFILWMMKIPFYSVISIVMGALAFVPTVGTILSFSFGFFLCLIFSPAKATWCAMLFFLIFLADRFLLQPLVIKPEARSSVLLSLVSVIVMYTLFGVIGALIAVPVALILKRWIAHLIALRTKKKNEAQA